MEVSVSENFLTIVIKKLLERGILTGSLRAYSLNLNQASIVGLAITVLKAFLQKLFRLRVTNEVASIILEVANEMNVQLTLLKLLVQRAIRFLLCISRRAQSAVSYITRK